jgi:hypothetical protein
MGTRQVNRRAPIAPRSFRPYLEPSTSNGCVVFTGNGGHLRSANTLPLDFVSGSPHQVTLYATCDSGYIPAAMACTSHGEGWEFNEWTQL